MLVHHLIYHNIIMKNVDLFSPPIVPMSCDPVTQNSSFWRLPGWTPGRLCQCEGAPENIMRRHCSSQPHACYFSPVTTCGFFFPSKPFGVSARLVRTSAAAAASLRSQVPNLAPFFLSWPWVLTDQSASSELCRKRPLPVEATEDKEEETTASS